MKRQTANRINALNDQVVKIKPTAVEASPGLNAPSQLYQTKFTQIKFESSSISTSGSQGIDANATFGSSKTINLSTRSWLGKTYLYLELPEVVKDVYLPEGWGLMAIHSLRYSVGGQQSTEITREQYFQMLMLECVTNESRNQIIKLAGEEVTFVGPNPKKNYAIIPLLLPFSSVNGFVPSTPIDGKALQDITLTIRYSALNEFSSGKGVTNWSLYTTNRFTKAEVYIRETELSPNSIGDLSQQSLAGSVILKYPTYRTGTSYKDFSAIADQYVNLTIDGLEEAELVLMSMMAVKNTRLNATNPANDLSMINSTRMYDLELRRLSNLYLKSPDESKLDQGFSMSDEFGGFVYDVRLRNATGDSEPFFTHLEEKSFFLWNVALQRATKDPRLMQSTTSFHNNAFNLKFKVGETGEFQLFILFVYNMTLEVSRGVAKTII